MAVFPGYPLTADKTNATQMVDDHAPEHNELATAFNALQGSIAAFTGPWRPLPLAAGFLNYHTAWPEAQYRRVGDVIQLRGLVKRTTFTTGTVATLPVGYRPPYAILTQAWMVWNSSRAGIRMTLGTTGVLTIANTYGLPTGTTNPAITTVAHLSLNGIHFSVTP
jgi:hypothetical protein